jgi:diketogulonate reductase-like aldo/keto reductase
MISKFCLRSISISKDSKLIFVPSHGDPAAIQAGLQQTLSDLGLEYLDLYLMHWPVSSNPESHEDYVPVSIPYSFSLAERLTFSQTWKSMLTIPKTKVSHLGVCNFSPTQLKFLIAETGVKPYAHQMELHPYLQQSSWIELHNVLGISVTAYSPLGNSNPTYDGKKGPPALLENKVLAKIAKKRKCTPAQVALAWGMRRGTSVIPKSKHEEYIVENFEAGECVLKKGDLKKIEKLGKKYLSRFNNPSKGWGVDLFEGLDDA